MLTNVMLVIAAIIQIEGGPADNPACIKPVYLADVNRCVETHYTMDDLSDATPIIMYLYMSIYSKIDWTIREYALLHRLGPDGMTGDIPDGVEDYCARVQNIVEDMERASKETIHAQ